MSDALTIPPPPVRLTLHPSNPAPAPAKLRTISRALVDALESGEFRRVHGDTRAELRGLAMTLDIIAEEIEPAPPPVVKRTWWKRIGRGGR